MRFQNTTRNRGTSGYRAGVPAEVISARAEQGAPVQVSARQGSPGGTLRGSAESSLGMGCGCHWSPQTIAEINSRSRRQMVSPRLRSRRPASGTPGRKGQTCDEWRL